MGFKLKKPKPPSVKKAVQAVKKAVPRPAAKAATAVRKVAAKANKAAPKVARAAQRISKSVKPSVKKAAKAIKTQAKKGKAAVKKVSKAAKKAGRGVSKAVSKTSHKAKKAAKAIKAKGKKLKSNVKKAAGKAKKAFAKAGKKAGKAAKSAKKKPKKSLQKAKKAKVPFPKNVKGPKATCPLLTGKEAKSASVMLKAPKFKIPKVKLPKSKAKAGAIIGGTIGMIVGGPAGAAIGAAVGAGIGRLQELNKPQVVNKRTPPNPRRGQPKPGNQNARTAAAVTIWPGQQSYNNCGVQSSAQIIAQATGTLPNEDTLLANSINRGWAGAGGAALPIPVPVVAGSIPFAAGGTGAGTRNNILANAGVPATVSNYSRETLAQAIWDRRGVIANLETNSASWWPASGGTGAGLHAVVVTDGVFDANGELTHVVINDTGIGSQGLTITIADWEAAVDDHPNPQLNITNNAIWP